MTIFPTRSPVDRLGPKLLQPAFQPGRLKEIARKFRSLVDSKMLLDKVYANGYFENHYPDADRLLKNGLHDQTMQAWARANSDSEDDTADDEPDDVETPTAPTSVSRDKHINLNITLNLAD